ncbi:NADPH:quinone oxidoreductase family protein [Azospirillum doebereinerae]
MKAVLCKAFGPADRLVVEEIAPVTAGPGQVVVAVKACGINFPDTLLIQDKYQFKPVLPFAPGGEIAGVVSRVGEGVTAWKTGDAVIAFTTWGGLAQEVAIDANRLIPKPPGMGFVEAAGYAMTYGTALYALDDRGGLQAGETLLVLGGAGGIGVAGIQIGKAMGATVIAGVSTPEKAAFCRRIGADDTIDYTQPDTKDRLKAMTGGKGVDVVLDPVGGRYTETALRAIAWDGRLLVVGFAAGDIPRIPTNLTLLKSCAVIGVFWGAFLLREGAQRDRHLQKLVDLHASGAVAPQISAVYPLEQAGQAIQDLQDRRATGKIVVEVGG